MFIKNTDKILGLIGQKENMDIINNWKSLPQFLIIQGDKHMGKTFLAKYLSQKYDLMYRDISVKVENIRKMIAEMKPGARMVYHFKDLDRASKEAQNSLLKVTEEPKNENYIIITGGPQLKTLESRAKKILINPYSKEEVLNYMKTFELYGIKNSDIETESIGYIPDLELQNNLIESGINSPAKAYYYKDYEKIGAILDFSKTITNEITYLPYEDILWIMSRFETQVNKNESGLDVFLLFLNLLITNLENKLKNNKRYSYKNQIEILLNCKNLLTEHPDLNRKMLIYDTFYQIYLSNKVV